MIEVLSRCLCGTRKKPSHYDSARAKGEYLDNVPHVANTTIRDHRNTKLGRKLSNSEHSRGLWPTNSHNFLGDTNGITSYVNAEGICPCGNEVGSLFTGNNVACNNFEIGERLLDPLDHVDLKNGITLRRIKDDNIKASLDKEPETVAYCGPN
jgi:hypothetical protein